VLRARGASYGRGAARSVAKRLRLSNETITRAPRVRIDERGRGKSSETCLLGLLEAPGPCPVVPEPWLLRIRTAENARRRNF
jgi:hypothetical protein